MATKRHIRHRGFSNSCALCAFLWLFLFLFTGTSDAQQQETLGLTDFPAPPWPQDAGIPPELKGRYVFVDLAKNEYVLAYPANLGTPAFDKEGPSALKISRHELLRNVDPAAQVEVTRPSPTKYRYAYTITNGPSAKQSIDQWSLVVPLQAGNDPIKKPTGWFAGVKKRRPFK